MKKTVLYQEIDGHKIIIGFDRPTVDPIETNRIVNEAIIETDEYKAAAAKKSEYNCAVTDMKVAAANKNEAKYNEAMATMSVRQGELKPIAAALADKIIALKREKAVYFEPRRGEVVRDEADVKTLQDRIMGLQARELLTLDGAVIPNNRRQVYFRKVSGKWGKTEIVKLGDTIPGDAVLAEDVTLEQDAEIERDRVAALPVEIKDQEKQKAEGRALADSIEMRSGLEIQGDKDALKKSKKRYDEKISHIKELYR